MVEYEDFSIKIEPKRGDVYPVIVLHSPAGEGRSSFALPFNPNKIGDILFDFSRTVRSSKQIVSRNDSLVATSSYPKQVGDQLFNALFTGPVRSLFDRSLGMIHRSQHGLRINLHIDPEDPSLAQLASLPWEFMYRKETRDFLNLSRFTPIIRYLDVQRPYTPLPLDLPLRILIVISDPADYERLDLNRERELIESSWAKQEDVQVEFMEEATILALQDRLGDQPFHVLHYMGHGDFDERRGRGVLVMEDEDEKGSIAEGSTLGILLRDLPTMRLVFLNACETARVTKERGLDPFAGVASAMVMAGIPAVVAMQFPVSDRTAITFSQKFYTLLARGYPIHAAVAEGRRAIRLAESTTMEWGTPVLFMRAPKGIIFQVQEDQREMLQSENEVGKMGHEKKKRIISDDHKADAGILERLMLENPFTYGNPISDPARFFGRRHEVDQIYSRLLNAESESSSIVGERRIGKTSLLHYLKHDEVRYRYRAGSNNHIFVYMDLQMIDPKTTPTRFSRRLLGQLAKKSPDPEITRIAEAMRISEEIDNFALSDLFDAIDAKNLRVVMLLDEFDNITTNTNFEADFFYGLRSLAIQHNLSLITSSRRELIELTHSEAIRSSPFFNIFANINVRLFSKEEAQQLVEETLSGSRVKFNPQDLDFLSDLSGTHPFFLQVACHFLYSAYQQGLEPKEKYQYVRQEYCEEAAPHLANYWRDSNNSEKIVLTTLALLTPSRESDQQKINLEKLLQIYNRSEQTLTHLEKRGLVIREKESFSLFSRALGEWIILEITNTTIDQQSYQDWLELNMGTMERLSDEANRQLSDILPKISAIYRDLIIEWVSEPRNLLAVTDLLKGALNI